MGFFFSEFLQRLVSPIAFRDVKWLTSKGNKTGTVGLINLGIDQIFSVDQANKVIEAIFTKGIYRIFGFDDGLDRKSTRLNSSHVKNSYAVFCLKKKI